MFMRFIFVLSLLFLGLLQVYSQEELMASTDISLLTCESGDELYSTFGHTGLRLRNDSLGTDIVYNYGMFDFEASYFYPKFLRGKLPYWLGASSTERFLRGYQYEQRSVYEQQLNLTREQRIALVDYLQENIRKENRQYKYDFFFDNCTTRAIGAIDGVTGTIEYATEPADITFRGMLKGSLQSMPWSEFGIDLIIGAVADQKTSRKQQHFLPLYLYRDLAGATVVNKGMRQNLIKSDKVLLDFEGQKKRRSTRAVNWPLILVGVLLLLELLLSVGKASKVQRLYDRVWFWLMCLMGTVMSIMWWGTEHLATKDNWNLLWASPLFGVFLLVANKQVKQIAAALIGVGCLLTIVNSLVTFLPQYFLPAFGLMALISVVKLVRWYRLSVV